MAADEPTTTTEIPGLRAQAMDASNFVAQYVTTTVKVRELSRAEGTLFKGQGTCMTVQCRWLVRPRFSTHKPPPILPAELIRCVV